jgi:hypothetical protein
MFDIGDTQRLVARCLVSLAIHGDPIANELLDEYFTEGKKTQPHGSASASPPRPASALPIDNHFVPPDRYQPGKLTLLKASGVRFHVKHKSESRSTKRVISGYSNRDGTYVLFRSMGRFAIDGIGKLLSRECMVLGDPEDPNRLRREDWSNFIGLWDGATFTHNGKIWKKLSIESLNAIVGGKTFQKYVEHGS